MFPKVAKLKYEATKDYFKIRTLGICSSAVEGHMLCHRKVVSLYPAKDLASGSLSRDHRGSVEMILRSNKCLAVQNGANQA